MFGKLSTVILLTFIIAFGCSDSSKHPSSTIIFLNGTSSAGKSSIAHALQERLDDLYLHTGLDHFLWVLSPCFFDHNQEDKCGFRIIQGVGEDPLAVALTKQPEGKRFAFAIHRAMLELAEMGMNLIIEEALFDEDDFQDYLNLFHNYRVYFIGVDADEEVLEQREKLREDRRAGIAKGLRKVVNRNKTYDLTIDTTFISQEEAAERIIQYMKENSTPKAFRNMNERTIE